MKKLSFLLIMAFITLFAYAQGTTELLYVNSKKVPSPTLLGAKCFQIKDAKKRIYQEWERYTGEIRGFNYQEGFIYTIQVKKIMHEMATPSGDTFYYKLVKIIGKKKDPNATIKLSYSKYYIWEYLDGKTFKEFKILNAYIQFDVTANQVSGNDGCNGFGGTIKSITHKTIKFGPLMGTLMACPDLNNSDFKIKQLLEKVNGYRLDGIDLELLQGNKTVLKCSEASASIIDASER